MTPFERGFLKRAEQKAKEQIAQAVKRIKDKYRSIMLPRVIESSSGDLARDVARMKLKYRGSN